MINVDGALGKALVLGGGVLGGGGGGSWEEGLYFMELALQIGVPRLARLDEVEPEGYVLTVSAVGAPAATEKHVLPKDYVLSVQGVMHHFKGAIAGFISSENGGFSTANGFLQSAFFDIPVVDAPADGRAHPMGIMGSLGLHHLGGYISRQSAVGGQDERRVQLYVEGSLQAVDAVIRQAAVAAGGLVAVARNPVPASFLHAHGAPGGLSLASRLGEIILEKAPLGGIKVAEEIVAALGGGEVLGLCAVESLCLETREGYDLGWAQMGSFRLSIWNEYMALQKEQKEIARFPDLIFTLDPKTGYPTTSAQLERGKSFVLGFVPADKIPLGAGVKDEAALKEVSRILEKVEVQEC